MPQMAPINWFILFTMFIMMFMITSNFLYFYFLKKNSMKNNNSLKIKNYNKFI